MWLHSTNNLSILEQVRIKDGKKGQKMNDEVNHPKHYTIHPSGIETIELTEHMNFCLGNVIKYVMRAPYKGKQIQDLEKAAWYLNREINRLKTIDKE
jgi:hypothetical protein